MKSDNQHEASLFQAAAQLTGDARISFLDNACRDDKALRQRLEALLAAHEQSQGMLAESVFPEKATMKIQFTDAPDETIGQKIGRYKILEKIGEGGCGVVYVAEQTEPVRRRVALKVIKLGMDTKQVVARFEAERQALAMMDHPNIAKVFDAGTTETGRPYFIMELVRGIRLTDYCDQNNLSTGKRLELFIKICQAIQHAHQKGIIHRDIKSSNILVTLHDGVPVPKVIDFGIAKATEGRLTDATVYTQLHQFIGTPAYMSPEQAEMSGLDIDTRSDIYSLGVLLYELLTGRTPFDAKELMSLGLDAMRKMIREKEPARPSTKVATLQGEELSTTATRRTAEAPKLISQLRGDLDWIVMKCLEKDRTRRYETAIGLAVDLKRHLDNEPVVARPASAAYKFQKAFRRNKLAFTAGFAITAILLLGIIATTLQSVRATRAKRDAVVAEQEQARLRVAAEQEAERRKKITLAGLYVAYGNFNTAEQILDGMPFQQEMIGLYATMGDGYARSGQWQQALTNYSKSHSSDWPVMCASAVLNFQVGNMEGYDYWRSEMLREFAFTNGYDASYSVPFYLITSPSTTESKTISRLVDVGLASRMSPIGRNWADRAKGFWEYRQGHFSDARNWLQKAAEIPSDSWDMHVQTLILLAMSEYQLKQTDNARADFTKGLQVADKKMIKPGNNLEKGWTEWLLAHFLMTEMAEMMPDVIASNNVFAAIVAEKASMSNRLNPGRL